MKVDSMAAQLFFTTAFLTAKSSTKQETGTGFVYKVDSDKGSHFLLVTNKHLIEGFDSLAIRFLRDKEGVPVLGVTSEIIIPNLNSSEWVGHPNVVVDVAVIPLSAYTNHQYEIGEPAFFKSIDSSISFGVDINIELNALEEITFIGYPAGIFDSHNFLPIARRGMTATPVEVNYQNQPSFLIDASVHGGSSGSPVFILNQGWITDSAGNLTAGSRLIFLGLIASRYGTLNNIEIKEIVTAHTVAIDTPIGLGVVYKAVCVDECAEIFLKNHGLIRKKSNLETGSS